MPKLDISRAVTSDQENNVTDYVEYGLNTDGVGSQEETTWVNTNFSYYWNEFNTKPDLKSALLMKSIWTVGKGYTCDPGTQVILDHITGWGKDSFDDILFNMDLMSRVAGDSFAEIIRDADTEELINLKPLDPSSIRIVVNRKGIIKRYEQISKLGDKNEVEHIFQPEEILHFSHNRLADQIHGISDIEALRTLIAAEAESFDDSRKASHRQARPLIMFKLKTDDAVKIQAFADKMDSATNKGENIYIPDDENTVSFEIVQVNMSESMLSWRADIRNKFYRAVGLPLIIFGNAGTTESGGKIEYLAHEQVFEHDQRRVELNIWNQLFLKIDLTPPATLQENLQRDEQKDAGQGLEFQQNDVTAGSGR